MDKICGNCHHFIMHQAHGPWCTQKRKEVSFLKSAPDECFAEPGSVEESAPTKICKRCGRALPLTAFGRHSRTKDGYQPLCKACLSEQNKGHNPRRAWKKAESALEDGKPKRRGRAPAHPDYIDEETGQEMHWCGKCKQYKPTDRFNKNRANASGLESYCKECSVAHERERRARKREEKKEQELQAAAHEAVQAVKKVLDEQPRVNAPAGGLRLPERLEKTVPKVVNDLFVDLEPVITLRAATDDQLVEELKRRGYTGSIIRKTSFIL